MHSQLKAINSYWAVVLSLHQTKKNKTLTMTLTMMRRRLIYDDVEKIDVSVRHLASPGICPFYSP